MVNFQKIKPKIIKLANDNVNIELLWLYGSYATQTPHKYSDMDLAVIFKIWEKDIIERRLRSELLALEWQKQLNLREGQLSILGTCTK